MFFIVYGLGPNNSTVLDVLFWSSFSPQSKSMVNKLSLSLSLSLSSFSSHIIPQNTYWDLGPLFLYFFIWTDLQRLVIPSSDSHNFPLVFIPT